MAELDAVRVLRRSPGRLRLHAPWLSVAGEAGIQRVVALSGVRKVQLSPLTGSALIEFDPTSVREADLLAMLAGDPVPEPATLRAMNDDDTAEAEQTGWLCAERSETLRARPLDCVTALIEFERYPEWQKYVTEVSVEERDRHGRGVRVRTRATVAERQLEFTACYRFPSPNRVTFEHQDGELGALRGSWDFVARAAGAPAPLAYSRSSRAGVWAFCCGVDCTTEPALPCWSTCSTSCECGWRMNCHERRGDHRPRATHPLQRSTSTASTVPFARCRG